MKYKKRILAILVGASLVLSGCGGGGGGSSESSHTATVQPSKLQRHVLEAEDITAVYYENENNHDRLVLNPSLEHLMGTPAFTIVDSEPKDIAQVEPTEGKITVFKPGTLTVKVTDTSTTYENSDTTFTVTIDRGINHLLQAQNKEIAIEATDDTYITASNNKGNVTYEVAEDSRHLLEIDRLTGKLTPLTVSSEPATVIIYDEGNDRFAPTTTTAKVTIKAISPSTLSFAPLSTSYSPYLLLEPWRVSGDDGAEYRYNIAPDAAPDVVSIDETTGQMTVNKVGKTVIEVTATYGDHYDRKSQSTCFEVKITEGLRMAIGVDKQTYSYVPGEIIQPSVSHAISTPRFEVMDNGDVITTDKASGYLKIVGVGSAYLKAIDDSNPNYPPSHYFFTLTVIKGVHPGLKQNTVIRRTYSDALTITPHIDGQYGDLSVTSVSENVSISDDDKVTVLKAGTTNLSVTDSGGSYYNQSSPVPLVLEIASAIHPAIIVTGLTTDYTDKCFAIDNYVAGAKGPIAVTANSNPDIATYDPQERCIRPLKSGSTGFTLYSQQSDNYEASDAKTLPVIINKAGATLKPAGDVWGIYGGTPIDAPEIRGQHGNVRFELAENAAIDVVDIDAVNGSMKMLNAGTTRIKVTDSGNEQHQGASTYFSVTVKQAPNLLGISYPGNEVFKPGKRLVPTFTDRTDGTTTTFEITTAIGSPIKLINASTGELEVQSAGDYSLKVTAMSRNYQQKELTVRGTIQKTPHPGLVTEPVEIEYSPLKTYQLEFTAPAIGKRVFSAQGQNNFDVNPNTGLLTFRDFDNTNASSIVYINEDGNNNYEALEQAALQHIYIKAPGKNASHQDITLDKTGTIFSSRLNRTKDVYPFRSLKDTKVNFAGIRIAAATEQQLIDYGIGVNLIVAMIPEGEEDTLYNRKQAMVYAQRFDGCPDRYNMTTVSNGTAVPVAMDDGISCGGEDTNRFLTFTVVDDHYLSSGNWQAVGPFVVFRQSDRPFKPTANGGCYQGNYDGNYHGCPEEGLEEPSIINEWNRIDVRISK